jgi:hypothetical protein
MERRFATMYRHEQTTPATQWVINHYLKDYPIVDVYVSYNDDIQKIIPSAITYVNQDTCTVDFTVPFSGYASVV